MKDLEPPESRKAYLLAPTGQYIFIGVPVQNRIWATDEGDRVTFSKLAAN